MAEIPAETTALDANVDYPLPELGIHPIEPEMEEVIIPVRIVEGTDTPQIRDIRLLNVRVDNAQVYEVCARNPDRARILFRNSDAAKTVWLLQDRTGLQPMGFALPPLTDLELLTEMPVYATCAAGDVVILSVAEEVYIQEA